MDHVGRTREHDNEQTRRLQPWTRELAALLSLGVPMALVQLVQFSVNTIDVLMIGRLGPAPLAASSLGQVLFFMTFLMGAGPALAVSPLVSQALGRDRNDTADVRVSVRMALWAIGLLTPLVALVLTSARPIALVLGQPPELAELAAPYALALAPSLPFMMGVLVLRNYLAAIERTRVPLLVVCLTTALNALLNYMLIYGHWGAPRLELVGAGIASSLSHAAGFGLLAAYVTLERESARFFVFRDVLRPDWGRLHEVVRLGWPIGVTMAFEAMLFNAAVFLMGRIGVHEVAAYQVALNVAALAFMIPLGLSMAGSVRVGLAAGAGNPDGVRRAAVVTVAVCAASIMLVAVPVMMDPAGVAALYVDASSADSSAVLRLIAGFLPIAAAFALFDATQVAANQCLRGLKDVRIPMLLTGISYWLIGFPAAAWLGLYTTWGANGVWWGLLLSLVAAAAALSARLYCLVRPREATLAAAQ